MVWGISRNGIPDIPDTEELKDKQQYCTTFLTDSNLSLSIVTQLYLQHRTENAFLNKKNAYLPQITAQCSRFGVNPLNFSSDFIKIVTRVSFIQENHSKKIHSLCHMPCYKCYIQGNEQGDEYFL